MQTRIKFLTTNNQAIDDTQALVSKFLEMGIQASPEPATDIDNSDAATGSILVVHSANDDSTAKVQIVISRLRQSGLLISAQTKPSLS